MERNVAIGQLLREKRLERGWKAEEAGILYGNATKRTPATGGAIFSMEEGNIPEGLKRRWVLARMYDIVPAALGLEVLQRTPGKIPASFSSRRSQSVDISEYQATLDAHWKQGYLRSPEFTLQDLGQRIYALHDNVYYARSPQRDQMKRLLWGYHVRRAGIAHELFYYSGALDHLNKAIILAQEENFADLEVTALYKRGEFFFARRDFPRALRDLEVAQNKKSAPGQVRGRILDLRGLTKAHLVQTDGELSEAMKCLDASECYITSPKDMDITLRVSLTDVRYQLDRAKALLAPTQRGLHLPDEAYDVYTIGARLLQKSNSPHKLTNAFLVLDTSLILARYYLDTGYYPMAITQLEEALSQMEKMNVTSHLPTVECMYEELKGTSCWNSIELAELGLRLLFMQYSWLGK